MTDRTTRVRLEAITSQYEAALAKAGLSTRALATEMATTGKVGESSFKKMAAGMLDTGGGTLAAGAAVAVLGAAVLKFTKDGVDSYVHLVDQVRDYQNVTGASAEESSKMVAVANALGISTDTLASGMFRLNHNLVANGAALQAAGVETAHNRDGSVDLTATLLNLSDAYQRVGGGSRGAELARQAFGRGATQIIPILKQGTAAIDGYVKAAEKSHGIVTEDDLKNVFEFHVATRELDEAWSGLGRELGATVVPRLTQLAVVLTDLIDKADGLASVVGGWGNIFEAVVSQIPGVGLLTSAFDLLSGGESDADKAANKLAEDVQRYTDAAHAASQITQDFTKRLTDADTAAFAISATQGKYNQDLADFADKIRAAQIGHDKNATAMDISTSAGIANRTMLHGLVTDILATAKAAQAQGQDAEAATLVQRQALGQVIDTLHLSKDATDEVTAALQLLGGVVVAPVIDVDTSKANAKINDLMHSVMKLDFLGVHPGADTWVDLPTNAPALPSVVTTSLSGHGPAATAARDANNRSAKSAADDAAQQRASWLAADDAFNKSMFDHHMKSSAEYEAYLDGRMAMETKYSQGWFALLDERQRVEDQKASDEKAWNDQVAENRANDIKTWMDTANAEYQTGVLSRQQYRQILVARLADLTKYSAEYMEVWNQIHQIDEQNVADQEALLQRQQQAADQAAQQRTDALGKLNSLLDDAAKLHKQQEDLEAAHRQKMADIQAGFVADQQKIIDERRGQLLDWAHIDEQVTVGWGTSIAALASNVHDQMDVFNEWVMALAQARSRGVSDQVISLLGLDQGPEALGQLRMFTSATDGEIADLNDAVAARTKQAGDRVTDETTQSFTKVAGLLKDLAEKHAAEIEKLTEDFLAQERSLTDQLKALGTDAGRSWADAIAAGIMSGIPGLVAAAQAAQAAITASNAAKDVIVRGQNPGNLKDVAPGTKGVTLTPAINVGGTTVQVGVSIDGKALDGAFDVRVKDKNTRASLARVN